MRSYSELMAGALPTGSLYRYAIKLKGAGRWRYVYARDAAEAAGLLGLNPWRCESDRLELIEERPAEAGGPPWPTGSDQVPINPMKGG